MLPFLVNCLDVTAALYLAMAVYALTRPPSISNRLLFLIMFICSVWAVSYHQELVSVGAPTKLAWMKGRFAFLSFLTVLWFMLSVKLAGVSQHITPRLWVLLFIIPAVTVPIALTSDSHTWFRYGYTLSSGSSLQPLLFKRGPWCSVYDVYQIALQSVGLFLLVRALKRMSPVLRKPIALLVLSSLLPIIANLIFNTYASAMHGLNPAPLILFPAATALAVSVFRYQLLNVAPVARDMLFDHISDGIIITDLAERVVDLNTAAARMLGQPPSEIIGRESRALPEPWPSSLRSQGESRQAFCSEVSRGGPWFERTRVPVVTDCKSRGWMFIFQDITAQMMLHQQRINKVRSEEEGKRTQQWAMLLRDLHDGIGAVSANIGLLAVLGRKAPDLETKNALFSQIADLAKEGNIEVRTMMNSLESRTLTWNALFAEIRNYASLVLEPLNISFALTVSGDPGTDPDFADSTSIFRIVKESLTNAAKHAHATRVDVDFQFSDDCLRLTFRDNGRWKGDRPEGRGLRHLRQRVQDMGGAFSLETAPATRLTCLLPRKPPSPPSSANGQEPQGAPLL